MPALRQHEPEGHAPPPTKETCAPPFRPHGHGQTIPTTDAHLPSEDSQAMPGLWHPRPRPAPTHFKGYVGCQHRDHCRRSAEVVGIDVARDILAAEIIAARLMRRTIYLHVDDGHTREMYPFFTVDTDPDLLPPLTHSTSGQAGRASGMPSVIVVLLLAE